MPEITIWRDSPKSYPVLERMTLEELNCLLGQEMSAPNSEPDVTYMSAIIEVMDKKEADTADGLRVDTEAALHEFHEDYQGKPSMYFSEATRETESSHLFQFQKSKPRNNSAGVRILRNMAAMLAVVLILGGTASAFGVNLFQAVASWSNETFHFVFGQEQEQLDEPQIDPFPDLRLAVAQETDRLVVPTYAPVQLQLKDIKIVERSDGTSIRTTYASERGDVTFHVQVYDKQPMLDSMIYQRDMSETRTYRVGDIEYILMSNNERCNAVWLNENVECCIQGHLTFEELEQMIDSIQ